MVLSGISVQGYKNIREVEIDFTSRVICFAGDNGAGKTNLLDAVHYLSMCRSLLPVSDNQCVRHGEECFMVNGRYVSDSGMMQDISCSYRNPQKKIRRNGKEYQKLSEHVGLIPVVVISPADVLLISDAAEERRRWLNSFISQTDKGYLSALIRYNAILAQRNNLLKMHGDELEGMLDIYDSQLAKVGEDIHSRRAEFLGRLAPLASEFYSSITQGGESIEVGYRSEIGERPLAELLAASRGKDTVLQYTSCGVHRDDVIFRIDGYPLKKFGSQGQQKSFMVALKLAQYELTRQIRDERPILLMDDLFDKLDSERLRRLLTLTCSGRFGQVFISDCDRTRILELLESCCDDFTVYRIADGEVREATYPRKGKETEA